MTLVGIIRFMFSYIYLMRFYVSYALDVIIFEYYTIYVYKKSSVVA